MRRLKRVFICNHEYEKLSKEPVWEGTDQGLCFGVFNCKCSKCSKKKE